jgi:hypothetical protein
LLFKDAVFTAPGGGFLVDLAFVVLDALEVELSAFKFAASDWGEGEMMYRSQ